MLNAAIKDIPLPARLARRPVSENGFPVPWFATALPHGGWDLVRIDPAKIVEAHVRKRCWVCGEPLGQYLCFVIGPMCAVNRVAADPCVHRDCAEYAVRACPFLARPRARRNETYGPGKASGIALAHNPGACVIWVTKSYRLIRDHNRGILFNIGPAVEVYWYAEGRAATRAEIEAAMAKGLPFLREMAHQDGPDAVKELEQMLATAQLLLPAA
jgi:hypothetical protein